MITNLNLKTQIYQSRLNKPAFCMSKPAQNTNFGGFTRLVMHTPEHPRPFHTTEEFLKIAGEFKSKTIGKLPREFLILFPEDPKKVFQFLDELSIFTRGLPCLGNFGLPYPKKTTNLKLNSGTDISIDYFGEGYYSKCFKINLPEKSYVFKTFQQLRISKNHGATDEVKAGINLSGESFKDLRKTHIGNFQNNHEWAISEFIDDPMSVNTREGKLLKKVRPEIKYTDEREGNRINGILLDMGGMKKINEPTTIEELTYRTPIYDKLSEIKSKEKQERAFYKILNSKDPEKKKGLGYALGAMDWDKSGKYFYDILNDPHIESKLGLEMNFDILPDEIKLQAYNDWLKYLKSHLTLCKADI